MRCCHPFRWYLATHRLAGLCVASLLSYWIAAMVQQLDAADSLMLVQHMCSEFCSETACHSVTGTPCPLSTYSWHECMQVCVHVHATGRIAAGRGWGACVSSASC